ncbi:hypothetical protein LA76x_3339 [Lysobacter antibioticus]|uniref:Uncharacterized protein n=1 Tax=Lysobacter antibioticus TaxID=84531 RepID=A0A0S2FD79_LYSAN|nr:hypothetical protein LA76x_3339 [Lysobacter antibioticus]
MPASIRAGPPFSLSASNATAGSWPWRCARIARPYPHIAALSIIGRGLKRVCHRCVIAASLVLKRLPRAAHNCGSTGHDDILFVYMTDNTCIDYRPISVYPWQHRIPLF